MFLITRRRSCVLTRSLNVLMTPHAARCLMGPGAAVQCLMYVCVCLICVHCGSLSRYVHDCLCVCSVAVCLSLCYLRLVNIGVCVWAGGVL